METEVVEEKVLEGDVDEEDEEEEEGTEWRGTFFTGEVLVVVCDGERERGIRRWYNCICCAIRLCRSQSSVTISCTPSGPGRIVC